MKDKEVKIKSNEESNSLLKNFNCYGQDGVKNDSILMGSYFNNEQIKSKERVINHGEVLTPKWLVNDMLDLLPISVAKIESRYLETSAGEGIFLVEILRRKLNIVFRKFNDNFDREFYTLVAICSIYGFELLKDNVEVTRLNLEMLIREYFMNQTDITPSIEFLDVVKKILSINIINMDSIKYRAPVFDNNNQIMLDSEGEIIYKNELARISEWEFDYKKKKIKRIEYIYKDIVNSQKQNYLLNRKVKESINKNIRYNLWGEIIEKRDEILEKNHQVSFFEIPIIDRGSESNIEDKRKDITTVKPVRVFESVNYLKLVDGK